MRVIVVSLLVGLLAACVTTKTGPYSENISVEKEVESRVQVAVAYLQQGEGYNPGQAISQLRMVYEKSPKSPRVNEVLGLALQASGENEKAEEYFERMVKFGPTYTRGRSNYTAFLISQGRYEYAEEQLHIIIKDIYFRNRSISFWQLAFVSGKLGHNESVEKYLLRSIYLDPKFSPAYLDLAYLKFNGEDYPESHHYLASYRKNVNQSSAKALLLGIKLAQVFKDKDDEASYALALRNLYPKSKEYLEYINSRSE